MGRKKAQFQGLAPREAPLQRSVASLLDVAQLTWCHVPNEGTGRTKAQMAELVRQGLKKGVPDVLIFNPPPAHPGALGVAIELKSAGGAVSPDQRQWLADLTAVGWRTYVARSLDQVIEILHECGWWHVSRG